MKQRNNDAVAEVLETSEVISVVRDETMETLPVETPETDARPPEHINAPSRWRVIAAKAKERQALVGVGLGLALFAAVAAVTLLGGGAKAPAPAGAAMPVTVQTLVEKNVRLWSDFSGRLQAVDFAEIRPEVSGRITQVRFEDGQQVKKGDVLFVIDPGPYEAALARAQASAEFAKTEFERAGELVKSQAIAQRVYDERSSAYRVAQAELARARIDYSRAYVKAPISGRVSRPEITVGNLVQAGGSAPLLASIVSNEGIYADFEVDDQTYLQTIRGGTGAREEERSIPVELSVQGDQERTYQGHIYSFDNRIDGVSGTIRARAKFANEDGVLMPGMFVSVRLGSSREQPALLVPERAVGMDQDKKFVYVVGPENKIAYREVRLGKAVGSERVVLAGVQAGDRLVVDGIQHLRPDVVVDPKEAVAAQPSGPAVASR